MIFSVFFYPFPIENDNGGPIGNQGLYIYIGSPAKIRNEAKCSEIKLNEYQMKRNEYKMKLN